MIQELLGTPTLIGGERKILPFNCGIILEGTPNPPFHPNLTTPWETPSSSSLIPVSGSGVGVGVSTSADAPSLTKNHSNNPPISSPESNKNNHNNNSGNNLRCPRCDSSNTKFCYYNNYNLAQPRHFCKTCRRYWTKGGALRNVPIGGGCHKSRPLGTSSTAISGTSSKSGGSKFKTLASEPGRPGIVPGFNHEIFVPPQPIPVFLASGPYNSHILSFFKGNQNPNSNHGDMLPAPAFLPFNEETTLLGSFPMHGQAISAQSSANERSLGIEPVGHHHSSHFQQQNCVIMGDEIPSSGVRSLFRRLGDLTGNNYYNESNSNSITPGIQPNTASTNIQSLSSPILESVPATTSSEPGCWNPAFSVSDLQMTNGAYP